MILKKINLVNYRNYEKVSVPLNNKINIFIGNNAQGKTNILESIYVLALTKSHRNVNESNLILYGKNSLKIEGKIKKDRILETLEIQITKNEKKVFKNKTPIKRISDYISNLNVILFTPDDLEIIKGSPSVRRNLLNIEISQISHSYITTLNEYNKLLKNRNEYLKMLYINHFRDEKYLDILTERLIEKAVIIYQSRQKFIDKINQNISSLYYEIAGVKGLWIKYLNNCDIEDFNEENIKEKLRKKYKENYKKELLQGMTLYGPHRDDFEFFIGEENLKLFGSQGQQRLSVICLKLAEIDIFKEKTNTSPILLLDDIFSEIDKSKKNKLIQFINKDIQTIITATDLRGLSKKIIKDAFVFKVTAGKIERR